METRYWGYSKELGWIIKDRDLSAIDCPHCQNRAYRIPRRFRDRLFSLIVPLRRYRCETSDCNWEGNLPVRRGKQDTGVAAARNRPVWQYVREAHAPGVMPRD